MLNVVCIQGRMVAQPELKTTGNGVPVCSFRVAVERNFASNGQRVADFFNVVAWRNTAEFVAKYFTKGQLIVVNGELQSREYDDKNGGKRTAIEIVASNVNFCGKEQSAQNSPRIEVDESAVAGFEPIIGVEDIPF